MKKVLVLFILSFVIVNKQYSNFIVASSIKSDRSKTTIGTKDLDCLVRNAYHEARGEGKLGMILVTNVVINRAKKAKTTYCSIVFKANQFSWTLNKNKKVPKKHYRKIEKLVLALCSNEINVPSKFKEATHFHTTSVSPEWSQSFKKLGSFNNHVFYKE